MVFPTGGLQLSCMEKYNLVFFSTFNVSEELTLPIKGPMEDHDAGAAKLYEPSPTPCLYVALAANMVGRIPLMPCFLNGNATPTIPHKYSKNKSSCFPAGMARWQQRAIPSMHRVCTPKKTESQDCDVTATSQSGNAPGITLY